MTGKLFFLSLVLAGCSGTTGEKTPVENRQIVGGGCDGCKLMYIGMPGKIGAVDTSAGWKEEGQKLVVSGTVFQPDGKKPAPMWLFITGKRITAGIIHPRLEWMSG